MLTWSTRLNKMKEPDVQSEDLIPGSVLTK